MQCIPTVADGLQYLAVEQCKTAKPISDSIIILFWPLKHKKYFSKFYSRQIFKQILSMSNRNLSNVTMCKKNTENVI